MTNAELIAENTALKLKLKEVQSFLQACEESSMSRNNMENLAGELKDEISELLNQSTTTK